MPKVGAEPETEEQQELKTRNNANMQETLMLVCPSDACVCTMHMHHEEARAALMRVACMCDWTKQTDPRVYDDNVKRDWNAS